MKGSSSIRSPMSVSMLSTSSVSKQSRPVKIQYLQKIYNENSSVVIRETAALAARRRHPNGAEVQNKLCCAGMVFAELHLGGRQTQGVHSECCTSGGEATSSKRLWRESHLSKVARRRRGVGTRIGWSPTTVGCQHFGRRLRQSGYDSCDRRVCR